MKKYISYIYSQLLNCIPSNKIEGFIDYRVEIVKKYNIQIGKSKIYKNVSIYKNKNSRFYIGNNSHIAPFCYFLLESNNIFIGNNVAVGPFCSFFCTSNYYGEVFINSYINGDIIIGDNVFIGAHSIILPGTSIEDNVIIGANSVVKGVLKKNFLYAGNLAKPIKKIK